MSAHKEKTDSTNGVRILVRSWLPESRLRAVVVVCHGVNSHGGQYRWVGEQFVAGDLAAYALDLRGRGRSDAERLYVDDAADYVADVAGNGEAREASNSRSSTRGTITTS